MEIKNKNLFIFKILLHKRPLLKANSYVIEKWERKREEHYMTKRRIEINYVKQFVNGEQGAFEYIFNFYKNPVYNFAMSIVKNKVDAEEVLQETFIKILEKIGDLKNINSFHTWLFTITYRESYQVFRKHKHKIQVDQDVFEQIEAIENVEKSVGNKMLQEGIEKAIQKLPEDLFEVTYFRYVEDFKMKEIATILDMPLGTVKSKLSRAKGQIQKDLQKGDMYPRSYVSYSFGPIFVGAMQQLYNQEVSLEVTKQICTKAMSSSQYTVGKIVPKKSISTVSKVSLSMSLAGMIGCGTFVATQQEDIIEDIIYIEEVTNKNIGVTVLSSIDLMDTKIQIQKDEENIEYHVGDKQVTFEVYENGTYTITINKESKDIVIDNIDKEYPEISNITYENNTLYFDLQDTQSKIDYTSSYIINEEKQVLSKEHKVENIEHAEVIICVYDKAGNYVEYIVNISDVKES